jgi:hypothetical protein
MKTLIVRYLNEIVGLTVMALMVIALVAAQAEATAAVAVGGEARDIVEIRFVIGD